MKIQKRQKTTKGEVLFPSTGRTSAIEESSMKALVTDLGSHDDGVRVKARHTLVSLGKAALPSLIVALKDKNDLVRWEAAKTLGEIGDPESAPALVKALEDKDFDVRWLAAEGLTRMNIKGLKPLLEALRDRGESALLREGAHHVFHDLNKGVLRKTLTPVLSALEIIEHEEGLPGVPEHARRVEAPRAALQALEMLEKVKKP